MWYNAQAMEHKVNYSIIKKKMLLAFKGLELPIQFLNEMQRCKHTKEETVDQYIYEKLILCHKVNKNMSEMDKICQIIQGLKPAIRDSVISQRVTTIDKIIEQAKRKEQSLRMIERAEKKKPNQDMTENIKHMIADQIKA